MIEILAIVLFVFVLAPLAIAAHSFAPWIPTDKHDLERIIKIIKLRKGEVFYELGCGDGRVVFYANRVYGNMAVGIELAFPLFLLSKIKQLRNKQSDVTIKNSDLFKEDLSKADVVYLFCLPKIISHRLRIKMEKELKKGSRVISYGFQIDGWKPVLINRPNLQKHPIFLYKR